MAKKRRRRPAADATLDLRTIALKTLIGSAAGMLAFFIFTAVTALIGWKNDMETETFKYMMLAVGALAGLVSGFTAAKPVGKRGLIIGALSALPLYFMAALAATTVSRSGINMYGWILAAVMLASASVGGVFAVR